jgi:hypothetical protein
MSNTTTTTTASLVSVENIRKIGATTGLTSRMAGEVVEHVRAAHSDITTQLAYVTGAIHFLASGCECPTGKGKTCTCGNRPAQRGKNMVDNYATGVNTLAKSVRAVLRADSDDAPKTPVLRVSISGEGGSSAVVDMSSELGVAILAYLESSVSSR